jgi:hypothetical protein
VNQKIVIGIIVVIVLIMAMALPVMHSLKKDAPRQQTAAAPSSPAPIAAPVPLPAAPPPPPQTPPPPPNPPKAQQPLVWEGTYAPPPKPAAQYQVPGAGKAAAAKSTGPDLTAETLVGTVWQVDSPYGPVTIEFGAGGQAVAMHSMIGAIPASWRVQGNKVVANASAMGQSITIDATIKGQSLEAKGQNIMRVR